jgi:hypothetical protein
VCLCPHQLSGNGFQCCSLLSFRVPWLWSLLAGVYLTTNLAFLHDDLQQWGCSASHATARGDSLTTASDMDWSVYLQTLPFGWLNCCWPAPVVIPHFSLLKTHSFLDVYVFWNEASSLTKEGLVFLCRHYVCCTRVSVQVYLCCHSVQVTTDSVYALSLHYTM